jgi:hypothetical protein
MYMVQTAQQILSIRPGLNGWPHPQSILLVPTMGVLNMVGRILLAGVAVESVEVVMQDQGAVLLRHPAAVTRIKLSR